MVHVEKMDLLTETCGLSETFCCSRPRMRLEQVDRVLRGAVADLERVVRDHIISNFQLEGEHSAAKQQW